MPAKAAKLIARTFRTAVTAAVAAALSVPTVAWAGPTLLLDAADGTVLYAEDHDNQWHPASLTKIMTAYVVFEAIREGKLTLQSRIGCSELAHTQPPSKIGLPVGAQMTVETALHALIVKSANDVAIMLAEAVAETQDAFVVRMNATAAKLGMTRTKFSNANGLPASDQVTTARDLAKLAAAVLRDYPEYAGMWSMVDARVGKIRLRTHNGLLTNYEGADGLKTGFICDSGFNVVATASRDGRKLIAVVLGEPTGRDRTVRAANLLEHGFQTREWKALLGAQSLDMMPIDAAAKGPVTMRQAVISYECGTRRRPVAKKKKSKAAPAVAQKKDAPAKAVVKAQAAPKAAPAKAPAPAAKKTSQKASGAGASKE